MLPIEDMAPSEVVHLSPLLTVALSAVPATASVNEEAGQVSLPAARKRERGTETTLSDDSLAALPLQRPAKRPHRRSNSEDIEKLQYRWNLALKALSVVAQHWKLFPSSLSISASVLPLNLPFFRSFTASSIMSSESPSPCSFPSIAISSTVLRTTPTNIVPPSSPVLSSPSMAMYRFASPKDFFFSCAVAENMSRLLEIAVCEGNGAHLNNNNNNENDNNNEITGEDPFARLFRALSTNCSLFSHSNPLPVNPFAAAAEEVGECSEDQNDEDYCDDLFVEEEDCPATPTTQFRSLLCQFLHQLLFSLPVDDENYSFPVGDNIETTPGLDLQRTKRMLEFAARCLFLVSHHFLLERWLDEISTFGEVEIGENNDNDPFLVLSQINGDLEHLEKCALSLIFVCDLASARCASCEAMTVPAQGSLIVSLLKLLDEFSVRSGCVGALSESLSSLATHFSFSSFLLSPAEKGEGGGENSVSFRI